MSVYMQNDMLGRKRGDCLSQRILIAQADEDVLARLKLFLESSRHTVVTVDNGVDAVRAVEQKTADLIILDLVLPKMDGYEVIRKIRSMSNLPIVILSAKDSPNDKILALNLGADDYLVRPLSPLEVVAHVNAKLRRYFELGTAQAHEDSSKLLIVGELCLDCDSMTLKKNDELIALTPMEYKILAKMMRTPGRVYTKVQLYESIYGAFFQSDDSTMMVHMSRLRKKIETDPQKPRYLKTIKGLGYKLEGHDGSV